MPQSDVSTVIVNKEIKKYLKALFRAFYRGKDSSKVLSDLVETLMTLGYPVKMSSNGKGLNVELI